MKSTKLPEAVVICMPFDGVLILPDNGIDRCTICKRHIQHRPDVAAKVREADFAFICMPCAIELNETLDQPKN